jgi:hypothetical protein
LGIRKEISPHQRLSKDFGFVPAQENQRITPRRVNLFSEKENTPLDGYFPFSKMPHVKMIVRATTKETPYGLPLLQLVSIRVAHEFGPHGSIQGDLFDTHVHLDNERCRTGRFFSWQKGGKQ